MLGHNHFYKLALAAAVAASFLFPSRGYAKDVQIFPPQTIAGLACPQGNSLALTWDGTHNVECSNIPTCNAALGQASNAVVQRFIGNQTFSTRNFPSKPAGRKSKIKINTAKAMASL